VRKLSPLLSVSLAFAIGAATSVFAQSASNAAPSTNPHIKNATAFGEIFPEGEKITAAFLEYDQAIDSAKLTASSFSVKDRKIVRVYANTTASKTAKGVNGRFVVIELDPADPEAAILGGERSRPSTMSSQSGPGAPAGLGGASAAAPRAGGGINMPGGGGGARKPVKLMLSQVAEIATAKGGKIAGNAASFETNLAKNLIIDDFQQLDWKDPVTGANVMYNLYLPKGYDKNKSYPMVLFMHDASVNSNDHDRTLIQGLGAIVWASPADQAKHPSIVLAPQFGGNSGPGGPGGGPGAPGGAGGPGGGAPGGANGPNATAQAAPAGPAPGATAAGPAPRTNGPINYAQADLIVRLVNYITGQYSVDKNRMYTTGQSAGCMASLAIMIKYPDLFAAAFLVSGQQNAQETASLKDKKMWILTSEGDPGAFPGMNASAAVWEQQGAKVVRGRWSAREPASVSAANVAKMAAEHNNIMYTTIIKGTSLPVEMENSGASEHLMVMRYAYSIPSIRDWLFQQTKTPGK